MSHNTTKPIATLLKNGVIIPEPSCVFIAPEVASEHIAPGTIIHPFCRVSGSKTSIGPGCVLSAEAPVTIENCQLGSQVKLKGGYFSGATFLDNSSMESGAHVRPGTLMEEHSSGAHEVGLKQTVFFPHVVLGSLINFCDCLMAGGTGRKNHSEVGSSYVHFNFTPHQDKATPSLIGDVPRGVLLDQPPIFLGGQGGLVGPARIAFGAVVPAGIIIRKDVMKSGLAAIPQQPELNVSDTAGPEALALPLTTDKGRTTASTPCRLNSNQFTAGAYRSVDKIIRNNLIYIGNIYALRAWYRHVRSEFMTGDRFHSACFTGALEKIDIILNERINRLSELAGKMPRSIELNGGISGDAEKSYLRQQKLLADHWPEMREALAQLVRYEGAPAQRDVLLAEISATRGKRPYLEAITALSIKSKTSATEWLQSIVDRVSGIWKSKKQEQDGSHRAHRVHRD